jgi:hypothetical protein
MVILGSIKLNSTFFKTFFETIDFKTAPLKKLIPVDSSVSC